MTGSKFSTDLTKPHFSARVYSAYFHFLQTKYPRIDIPQICKEAGLSYEYLQQESNWVSVTFDEKFTQLCIQKTKADDFCYQVGAQNISPKVMGRTVALLLRYMTSLKFIFTQLPKLTSMFSRVTSVEVLESSKGKTKLQFMAKTDDLNETEKSVFRQNFSNIFQNTLGHYAAIPTLHNLSSAHIQHKTMGMSTDGFPIYEIVVHYQNVNPVLKIFYALSSLLPPVVFIHLIAPLIKVSPAHSYFISGYFLLSIWLVYYIRKSQAVEKGFNETVRSLNNLDQRYHSLFKTKELLEKHISANRKFTPWPLLKLLKCESILELELGSNIEEEMTVLFVDIRDFTNLSGKMSPLQTFVFLNSYLASVGPIITNRNGFVDKFLGDGVLAIFPKHPHDAIQASTEIIKKIREYNIENNTSLRVGIGINTGQVALGVIGHENRMQGTVVSDCVNIAARLEQLTKTIGSSILATKNTVQMALQKFDFNHRELGEVEIRGKDNKISIYDIYHGESEKKIIQINATKSDLKKALDYINQGQIDSAILILERVHKKYPYDNAIKFLLNKIRSEDQQKKIAS